MHRIVGENSPGLGRDKIHFGGNGGYQVINLAYLWGASRMVLLGYDMQRTGGASHWHGDHPRGLLKSSPYEQWIKRFGDLAADLWKEKINVVNASRETALQCFPRMPLEEALQ